jgi:putative endonuclease
MKRKETGDIGEQLALNFLKKKGFKIIETNYRCHRGEIDIVARKKDCLVFVEVKTRANLSFGTPEESITSTKQNHLELAANHYLQNHEKLPSSWRYDAVVIELAEDNKIKRIELIENALDW